ncbi:MAG: hypothetical protein R2695_14340 [Acidimicrobiales bacterium]
MPNANLGIVVSASRTRRQMIQRMGRVLRRKPLGSGARFVIIFSADTLEDPRYSDGGDGFLEEIESISESSFIFGPDQTDKLATFLDYTGPDTIVEPVTAGRFVAPVLSPDEITEWAEETPYLEIRSPELPTISQPKIVKEKPGCRPARTPRHPPGRRQGMGPAVHGLRRDPPNPGRSSGRPSTTRSPAPASTDPTVQRN